MIDKILNSKWKNFLLAISVATFVFIQRKNHANFGFVILNIPVAFILAFFIE